MGKRLRQPTNSTAEVESILEKLGVAETLKRLEQLSDFALAGCEKLQIPPTVSLARLRQYRPLRVDRGQFFPITSMRF
jgi:hypothetical protein